jgi:hypothetical protein
MVVGTLTSGGPTGGASRGGRPGSRGAEKGTAALYLAASAIDELSVLLCFSRRGYAYVRAGKRILGLHNWVVGLK